MSFLMPIVSIFFREYTLYRTLTVYQTQKKENAKAFKNPE